MGKTLIITPSRCIACRTCELACSFVHAGSEINGKTFSIYVTHLGWNLDGNHQCREFVDGHLAADPIDAKLRLSKPGLGILTLDRDDHPMRQHLTESHRDSLRFVRIEIHLLSQAVCSQAGMRDARETQQ